MKLNKKILTLLLGSVMVFALVGYKASDAGKEDVYGESGARSVSKDGGKGLGRGIGLGGGGVVNTGAGAGASGGGAGSGSSSGTEFIGEEGEGGAGSFNAGEDCVGGKKNTIELLGSQNNIQHNESSIKSKAAELLEGKYDTTIPVFNNDHKKAIRFGDESNPSQMIYCEQSMLGKSQVVIGYTTKQKESSNYKYNKLYYYYVGCCANNNVNSSSKEVSYEKKRGLGGNNNAFGKHLQEKKEWKDYVDTCNGDRKDWYECDKVKNQCVDFENFRTSTSKRSGKFTRCKPTNTSLYSWGSGGSTPQETCSPYTGECYAKCIKCEEGFASACDYLAHNCPL